MQMTLSSARYTMIASNFDFSFGERQAQTGERLFQFHRSKKDAKRNEVAMYGIIAAVKFG